jgi:hypothetical protein
MYLSRQDVSGLRDEAVTSDYGTGLVPTRQQPLIYHLNCCDSRFWQWNQ